ncbi:hypothetical protein Nisw_06635 [Candidatus Nitrosopumilus sp. SW]|uniref:cupredoxin domain-containing protein n=1 Tax=Candidatus Nitrosopumilus sp. SW TaxID=2508726 RepID=UPI0011546399|nr:plastocyanin/azurin family copper-binding protein [Candidatus Nitrosopumilus sp. SW]QDI89221.1 hypothetical protein Nisw_06635 [Candidatus Nitrosopumilus sp. SW]
MKDSNDKFGIALSVAITAIAIAFAGSLGMSQEGSIQPQGQAIIERTTNELQNIPEITEERASNVVDKASIITSELGEAVVEADTVDELVENTADVVEDIIPDVPPVVKQTDGKLLELVSIPSDTGVPGCEESNTCFIPADITTAEGTEIIWTNHDTVAHTITSGNPHDGPDGLFDSGLMMPNETYSIKLDLAFEYDYFCIVHPWMQGIITVE